MKKSFLFLCICLLALAGCKKADTEINKAAVSIVVLPMEDNSVSGSNFNYKLKAMIVSPEKLEVQDHGFLVSGLGPTEMFLSLGSGDIAGGIEYDFPSPLPEGQFTVAAYAKLKTGETIYSVGYNPSQSQPPTAMDISITSAFYNPVNEGSLIATFEGTITSGIPGRYRVDEVGIHYATAADYIANSSTYNRGAMQLSGSTATTTPIYLTYNIDGVDFYAKDNYHFRLYALVTDLQTSMASYIYSGDNTFSTP